MIKKGSSYYPLAEIRKRANLKDKKIYKTALKNPVKFWETLAKELFWYRKWRKGFLHKPPYFKWFVGGKINITTNIFEKNKLGWERIKNKVALIWEPEPIEEEPKILTYDQLFRKACKFANALKKLGVKKGDKVGIYLPMIPEALISMLACARIGACHSVVFSAFSPQALRVRLQDTQAKTLITADGYWRRGKIINLKKSADEGIKETNVKKVIVVKRAKNEIPFKKGRDLWFDELIERENDFCQAKVMDSEDRMFILYTSGSTGKPKGCEHACGGYTVQAYWTGRWIFDFKEDDILWSTADIGWITGHTYTVYSPLLNGVTTLIFEGAPDWPTHHRWAEIIEKHRVTIFYTAPTAIRMFEKLDGIVAKKYKFESLRILGSVGEPIDEDTWLWFFKNVGKKKCPIVDTWWQTETGGVLITSLPGIGPFKPTFTGLPLPGIKVEILDEKGKKCKPDQTGNLVLLPPFAPSLLRGVYKNPKKYLKTYWSEYGTKIYFTSDAAYKNKRGLIRIVGRVDDVIKVAGHRLSTGELENAVAMHPDIVEAAIVGIPDEIKGQVPVVFIVTKPGRDPQKMKKIAFEAIRKAIGPIAKPKEIYVAQELPKTRSGKIMRRILRKLFTGEKLGDLSTLANPESVKEIKNLIKKR
jgi:acetyl-CoA synthetase